MTTAPDTSTIPAEDDDETPPTPAELLAKLGQLHTRTMASPYPANPEAMGWQMIAAVAGFTRALHALNEQDPTAVSRITAIYHGPFGEGPNPQAHSAWLERLVAGPETFQRWVDEGRQAAAEAALRAMNQTGPADPEHSADSYPPALPWAALMDDEDLHDFLTDLAGDAIMHFSRESSPSEVLAAVEDTIRRHRVIAEAQHAHNTAPGPNANDTKEN